MLRQTKIRQYLESMRRRGFGAAQVLAGSGIREKSLNDPTSLIELEQYQKVITNLIQLTGNQCIGFEIGGECELTDLGVIGYAMASSNTLEQTIRVFIDFANSSCGLPVHIELFRNADESWGFLVTSTSTISDTLFKFYITEIIGMGLAHVPSLTTETMKVKGIRFSSQLSRQDEPLLGLLPCPILFNCKRNTVTVSFPSLDTPIRGSDNRVNDLCMLHCKNVMRRVARNGDTTALIRSLLLKNGSTMTLEVAAKSVHMSSRTLRRRLNSEGTSFQVLLDEVRNDLAKEFLDSGLISSAEIACRLGFERADVFRRAFKAWNGYSIREYCKTRDVNERPFAEIPPKPHHNSLSARH